MRRLLLARVLKEYNNNVNNVNNANNSNTANILDDKIKGGIEGVAKENVNNDDVVDDIDIDNDGMYE